MYAPAEKIHGIGNIRQGCLDDEEPRVGSAKQTSQLVRIKRRRPVPVDA
jgi:hypothetical protein